jgi:hypothetical protein
MDTANIKTQLQQFGQELKTEIQSANVGEDVKQQLATKIDQKLDELGARIGGDQSQGQTQSAASQPGV